MSVSGLIYAVIVAAWAGVLVPKWLRRNEEVDQAGEADAARGVRVLERHDEGYRVSRHPTHPHGTVFRGTIPSERDAESSERAPGFAKRRQMLEWSASRPGENPGPAPIGVEPDHEYELAARRRLRVFVGLIAATAALGVPAAIGIVPIWAPAPMVVLLLTFLVAARRAAVAQMYRRRHQIRLAARAVEYVYFDEADEASAPRIAVFDAPEPEPEDPDAWSPVDVPLPTYMTKPAVRRLARTIDLSAAGSWTSGRLDPGSAIEVPPQRSSDVGRESSDESTAAELAGPPEQRRAVGD